MDADSVSAAPSFDVASVAATLLLIALSAGYLLIFRRARQRASALARSSNSEELTIGTLVRLQGLKSRPELNGRTARITSALDTQSGRYAIEVEPTVAEVQENFWKPRIELLARPDNMRRELESSSAVASASQVPAPTELESDVCHRCLEAMPALSWRGTERNRLVCCGNQLCAACWTSLLRRREELGRRMNELKKQPLESVDREAAKQLVEELERTDKCDLCRAPAPHSPEASFEAVRRHAESGKAWAQYMLGNKYQVGAGVAKSHELAHEWFKRAAAHAEPHPNAAQALGSTYLAGAGVRVDYKEALRWLLPAAEAGHATAMHNLGQMHSQGLGVRRSAAEAVSWWLRGAEAGSHQCQSDLGCCYENGTGVAQSVTEAARWFLAAAEQGNATAQYNYGGLLFRKGHAEGSLDLMQQAVEWCRKSATSGNADAINMLKRLDQFQPS